MYVCMYVCMCIYVYICVYMCIPTEDSGNFQKLLHQTFQIQWQEPTESVGGNVSNFTRNLLKLSGKLLLYRRKQTECKNRNIFYFQACYRVQYIGRTSHSFLNRHLTKNVGGNISNFTRKLLKLSGKPLLYSRKQGKCKNRNIFYFQACYRLQYRQDYATDSNI